MSLLNNFDENDLAVALSELLPSSDFEVKVKAKDDSLQVMVVGAEIPDRQTVIPAVLEGLLSRDLGDLIKVNLYGRDRQDEIPDWHQELDLTEHKKAYLSKQKLGKKPPKSFFNQLWKNVAETTENVGDVASATGKIMLERVADAAEVAGNVANQAGQTVTVRAKEFGDVVGDAANQAGKVVSGGAKNAGTVARSAAMQATKQVGSAIDWVGDNPISRKLTQALPLKWLFVVDRVDLRKAEAEVRKLQQKFPAQSPREIAHRLMRQKAILSGGSGLASSLIPGAAAALFAVDLATNLALQAEMIYQIACAYGLDLENPARKGEVAAIFGLAFGGGQAVKVGGSYAAKAGFLGILRNIPFAGAVIGSSTNAAMTYALGYAACRFYESQVNPLTSEETLAASEAESEEYLQEAIAQEVVMDSILVHLVLAANPEQNLPNLLPELEKLNLAPASVEYLAKQKELPPLETLLEQINEDFAAPLLVKCNQVALSDRQISPAEAEAIAKITDRFDFEIDPLSAQVS
ncbi:MAG: hypothetical protein SAJ37_23445 [Oscillatoria sp. PMC 1068.18]|nr:hypothetical protein [Oscillatoria sp. PMC 1076.18]MEC4991701.1 hypothetical protein [Oscillatoria sp. PMC 1068.18]